MDPTTKTTTHIESKSQPERHTINRAELTVITTTLDLYKYAPTLSIRAGNAFSINNLRNYISDPHNCIHHKHRDLLILADNIIHIRDKLRYTTHIGKVKSHTGVARNDEANAGAHCVVVGTKIPDIPFTTADPPSEDYALGPTREPRTRKKH